MLKTLIRRWRELLGGAMAGTAATQASGAALPADTAELLIHDYDGGGVKATGPALLVRKSIADKVSLSAQYYVDAVSNASIDVVTTASPFKEKRTAWTFGATTVVRDTTLSVGLDRSREPDYTADTFSADATHEVFGGMTSVSLGFSRANDRVGKRESGVVNWVDEAHHWQYRVGLTQILTPRWLVSANMEVISDDGYLGSPYRAAQVFGAAVPENVPRTRTGRALKLRSITDTGSLLPRSSLRVEYRRYWDTWAVKSNTFEIGGSQYLGESFLLDLSLRQYSQGKALFYSDNTSTQQTYLSRNRQLSTFTSTGLSSHLAWTWPGAPKGWDIKLHGGYEFKQFRFKDFTDLRSGTLYRHNAHVLQMYVTAGF